MKKTFCSVTGAGLRSIAVLIALATAGSAYGQGAPARELYRPAFHFTARKNWLNDPNGLVYYRGEYHLFFQHNPQGNEWGNMTWGHAASPDLLHWQQLKNAITPDRLGTIFSGSAVVDWNNTAGFQSGDEKALIAIYTAAGGTSPESKGQPFTQCLAYSNDRGRTWTKYAKNPVLNEVARENRDPKVLWHAPTNRWVMALYKEGEKYALFSSPDLKSWTHLQDLVVPGCGECPDFFELPVQGNPGDRRWVFTAANGNYLVGTFNGQRFTSESGPHVADWGANYYAVQTYSDTPDARRIQIAWMRGGAYPGMPFNQQMSFPCEMQLRKFPEGLRITRWPVKEIERLRRKEHTWPNLSLAAGQNPLADIRGELFDVDAEIAPGTAREVGFEIRGEPVRYIPSEKRLYCLGKSAIVDPVNGRIGLRILADRTSLEVFANQGRVVMTSCFLPRAENQSLVAYASDAAATLSWLKVYELGSPSETQPADRSTAR